MASYAIGDVQGCFEPLQRLLQCIDFKPEQDCLWFAGDLVNRGPDSLACVRFIKQLPHTRVVLGNHDLHALCVASGAQPRKKKDTLDALFDAPDADELLTWLKQQALACYDADRHLLMTHAGIPPFWRCEQALSYAKELEDTLQGPQFDNYMAAMYGNTPDCWSDDLQGQDRLRVLTNYFTRMRFISAQGHLDFASKEGKGSAPEGFRPWFDYPRDDDLTIVFGHWAALMGATGNTRFQGIDTGCVWGNALTALNLDTLERTACDCA